MWRPTEEQTIVAAAKRGDLQETHNFDAKRELPPEGSKKGNRDLAVDVAAMTVDGGTLLYGVAEDAEGSPTVPAPIALAGQRERVDQIVQTLVSEPPTVEIDPLPTAADPSRGYLVVLVPPSPRAPHQVGGCYYGRGATGNRVLDEGEVARLYQRRREWEVDVGRLLDEEVASSGYPPHEDLIYLQAIARPVARQEEMVEDACGEERTDMMLMALGTAAASSEVAPQSLFSPDLGRSAVGWERWGGDSWAAGREQADNEESAEGVLRVVVDLDGTGHLFGGRAGFRMNDGRLLFVENYTAGNVARFLAILGGLYARAGYIGPVDLGVAVTGLQGAVSLALASSHYPFACPYPKPEFRRIRTVSAGELRNANRRVTMELVGRLVEASAGPAFDPFATGGRG